MSKTQRTTGTETITVADVHALIDQLGAVLERADRAQTEAIALCEQIENAAGTGDVLRADSAWALVALEAVAVREVLPGGGSEGDPREACGLLRDLAELAARRNG